MGELNKRQNQAQLIRRFRKVHRYAGIALFLFFFVIGVTGLLLGWKKNSNGNIHPISQSGKSTELVEWLPISTLQQKAFQVLQDSINSSLSTDLDRIDIRPNKGMAKFVFENHYWEIQLDASTAEVLQISRRNADIIENIHDGSIVDMILGIEGGWFKLFYTTVLGFALLTFTVTGFWLWYGPKRMKT